MVFFTLTKLAVILFFGFIFVIGGIVVYTILPDLIKSKVKESMLLKEGTEAYTMWEEIPIPLKMQFFLFNVTNADEIINFGAKPKLQQVGPYSYKEYRKKVNITFSEDNSDVTYKQIRTYYFDPESSGGKEDDLITFPNVPLISLGKIVAEQGMETLVNGRLGGQDPERLKVFIQRKAKELLFDGYYEPFVDELQKLQGLNLLPNGMFALYYGQNGTDDGIYNVDTGLNDYTKFAKILQWNNSDTLTIWKPNSTCNMINGTDGNQNPPYLQKEDKLYVFMSELCRSIDLTYASDSEVNGIDTYHFELPFQNLLDPTVNGDNECFCMDGLEGCGFSGLLDVSRCRFGAPIYFGLPHFLLSDPLLLKQVDGLTPDKEQHLAYLDIEPTTGIPLKAARRIQVNIKMTPRQAYSPLEISRLPDMIFPLLWVNEDVTIDEANSDKLKSMMITPVKLANVFKFVLIVAGCTLIVIVITLGIRRYKERKSRPLPVPNVPTGRILNQSISTTELINKY